MNRKVGRVCPSEPPDNVFQNAGALGQTRPTGFIGSKHERSLPPIPGVAAFAKSGFVRASDALPR